MSIQLVSTDHGDRITASFRNATNRIQIISPFIGFPAAKVLCDTSSNNENLHCQIITRFSREDFISGASNINALELLLDSGVKLFALKNLHTKLYLIDDHTALLGSANFTSGGFRLNHELSLLFQGEYEIIAEMNNYYDQMLENMMQQGDYAITQEKVKKEAIEIERLRSARKDKSTFYRNEKQFGAEIPSPLDNGVLYETDSIQDILADAAIMPDGASIWFKLESDANNRSDPNEKHSLVQLENFPGGITCFPEGTKPTGIQNGDYVYIAVVSQDSNGNNTPVIVGRGLTHGYEEGNRATSAMIEKYPWMEYYCWFVRLYNMEYIDAEIKYGISLLDLLASVGDGTYPSTVGKSRSFAELRQTHYHKSHMHLTQQAKKYLDDMFDLKTKQYGIIKI